MADLRQIETDLSTMEYALRESRAPALYRDYNVGFQLLEADEDEDRAVGVRVFRLDNGLWLYAPVVFVDGELHGEDLLYVKNKGLMVPFDQDWIAYLSSKHRINLGVPSDAQSSSDFFPDLSIFTNDTGSSLSGGAIKPAEVLEKNLQHVATLPGLVKINLNRILKSADDGARSGLLRLMAHSRPIAEYFLNEVDISLLEPKTDVFEPAKQAQVPEAKEPDILESSRITQPMSTGVYRLVLRDGSVKKCIVRVYAGESAPATRFLVFDPEKKRVFHVDRRIAAVQDPELELQSAWEQLYSEIESDEPKPGHYVVLLGPKIGDIDYEYITDVTKDARTGHTILSADSKKIILTKSEGRPVHLEQQHEWTSSSTVILPNSFKVVMVEGRYPASGEFLSPEEVHALITSSGKTLTVEKDASWGYVIRDGEDTFTGDRRYALRALTNRYGLGVKKASRLLNDADKSRKVTITLKAAGLGAALPPDLLQAAGQPAPPPSSPAPASEAAQQAIKTIEQELSRGESPELLNLAGLTAMIAASQSSQFIGRNLGVLLSALDRLGKILFYIYWHWLDCKEDWGADKLIELEQQLLLVFKELGKLIVSLREIVSVESFEEIFAEI